MKRLIDRICKRNKNTASIAKDRLQIIIAHERRHGHSRRNDPDFLAALQNEIVQVIAKYVVIDVEDVKVGFDTIGDSTVLEVNIPIKEKEDVINNNANAVNLIA